MAESDRIFAISATAVGGHLGAQRSIGGGSPPAADSSTIRAFFLTPLVRELAACGVAVDPFLRRYGLSAAQLTNLYERVPLRHFVALAEDAARRLERPFLGLELGGRFSLADLGPFCAMFLLAGDLRSALTLLARYQSTWQTGTVLELSAGSPVAAFRYCLQEPSIWPRRQDAEFSIASFTTFVRELLGSRWRPIAVEFEHDVSDRVAALNAFFNAPILGNCAATQLIIANSDLGRPLRWRFEPGEHDVALILERHLMELLGPATQAASQTVAARTGHLIARQLGQAKVTFESIAVAMGMSTRTLRRHLTREGTSFRQLLQAHRRSAIEAALHRNGARVADLAARLNYSDSAVLSRAFKTWTGLSPRAYARAQKR